MKLRVLIVEDSDDDAELVVRSLRRAGHEVVWERVDDAPGMCAALAREWDLVLSDWTMPGFSGTAALQLLRSVADDVPFILVTGSVDEATAVEAMRAGARDVIVKDRLARLVPAVERELRECEHKRRSRAALRLSEARFERLADSGIIAISISDVHGRVYDVNQAYCDLVGHSREEILDAPWQDRMPPEWQDAQAAAACELADTGVAKPFEMEVMHRDGHRVRVLTGVVALDGPHVMAFLIDLSERERAQAALRATEEQLRQAQKLEAIGSLAGGVAHDFNNILGVIVSYVTMAIENLEPGDPLRDDMLEVDHATRRATALTRQLLAFSRRQILQPKVLDLAESVADLERMLRRLIGEDVELALHVQRDRAFVKIDPTQIEQVLMNLSVNARDAMPRGGRLEIDVTCVELDEAYTRVRVGVAPGAYVRLSIADTGEGMDAATRAHIFEPFFTTKPVGKGTGLGLSTVFGIVQQSGGWIDVISAKGDGTTFDIYLPRVARSVIETSKIPVQVVRGNETVLLVEDDAALRKLTRTILKRLGYSVLEAAGPGDALLLHEQHAGEIQLLMTDVVMPRMSGFELAERLCPARPGMRVLFVSGYSDDAIARHQLDQAATIVQKPLTPDMLAREVRQLLDQSSQ